MPFWERPGVWDALHGDIQFVGWGRPPRGPSAAMRGSTSRQDFWRSLVAARAGLLARADDRGPLLDGHLSRLFQPLQTFVDVEGKSAFLSSDPPTSLDLEVAQKTQVEYGVESLHRTHREAAEGELTDVQSETQERMEQKTAQFVLRNVGRVERPADEVLQWVYERAERAGFDDPAVRELAELLRRRHRIALDDGLGTKTLVEHARYHRTLFDQEDWSRLFGHHISSNLDGPSWKYFVDDDAFTRYGTADSLRLEVSETDR